MDFVSKNNPRANPAAENPAAEKPLCSLGTNVWKSHSSPKKGDLCHPRMHLYRMLECPCPRALSMAPQLPVLVLRGEKQLLQLIISPINLAMSPLPDLFAHLLCYLFSSALVTTLTCKRQGLCSHKHISCRKT